MLKDSSSINSKVIATKSDGIEVLNQIGSKKQFSGPISSILQIVVIFLISQIIAVTLLSVIGLYLGHSQSSVTKWLNDSVYAQFGRIILAEGLAVAAVSGLLHFKKLPLSSIGIKKSPLKDVLLKAGIGFISFYSLIIIVSIAVQALLPQVDVNQKQDIGFDIVSTNIEIIITFVSLVVLPPIAEEILVRGYLFSALRSRLDFVPVALITSLLFGLAHLELGSGNPALWTAAIDTFVLALVLSYLREKSGVIWAGIILHSLNNLVAFLIRFHHSIF